MEALFSMEGMLALITLVGLEIVLGIDNIVFIAIIAGRLPSELRDKARFVGLSFAVITRLLLLLTLSWFMGIQSVGFDLGNHHVSVRDLVLLCGGLFLIYKATHEIHSKLEKGDGSKVDSEANVKVNTFSGVIVQILIIDIVFSLDSVITALGMVESVVIMGIAVVLSVLVMLLSSKVIVDFIDVNPTVKMLALSFLLMIGVLLVAESFHQEFNKGYVYFAMAFSLAVEMLNIKAIRKNNIPNK
jgi:predicted tellurium resistance membrane protein TerC